MGACEALRTRRKVRADLGWSPGKLDGEGSTWRARSHRGEKIGKDGAPKPSGRSMSRGDGHQCPVTLRGSRQRTARWVRGLSNMEVKGDLGRADLGESGTKPILGGFQGECRRF